MDQPNSDGIDRLLQHPLGPELEFGLGLTAECCRLAEAVRNRLAAPALSKEDRSPVTVADFAVQALAGCRLSRHFPADVLVAEESAEHLRNHDNRLLLDAVTEQVGEFEPGASAQQILEWVDRGTGSPRGRYWVLDPVDGTKGFLRNEHYAVALALIDRGAVQLGVLGCPRLRLSEDRSLTIVRPAPVGTLTFALRGEGAWAEPLSPRAAARRLRVSRTADLESAVLLRSVEKGHTNLDTVGRLVADLGIRPGPIAMDSQAKYGLLASGEGDLLVRLISPRHPDYREKVWDQAAGAIIVEEAGGRVTDLDGEALDFTTGRQLERNRGILATNGRLHDRLLEKLRDLGA